MNRISAYFFVAVLSMALFGFYGCGGDSKDAGDKTTTKGSYASKSREAGQPIDRSEEVSHYEAQVKKNPKDWKALALLADSYFGQQRFSEAIEYYKKAIAINPDDIDSYNDLGLAHHYLGRSQDGIDFIDEGIKRNAYYQRIWLTKGFVLAYGMGDLDGARTAWEKARGLDPESQIGKAAGDFLAQFSEK